MVATNIGLIKVNEKHVQLTGVKGILALPSAMFDGGDIDTKLVSELARHNKRWVKLLKYVYEDKERTMSW